VVVDATDKGNIARLINHSVSQPILNWHFMHIIFLWFSILDFHLICSLVHVLTVYAKLLCKNHECRWRREPDCSHCQDYRVCRRWVNVCVLLFCVYVSVSLCKYVYVYVFMVMLIVLVWTGMTTCLILMSQMNSKCPAYVKLQTAGNSWIRKDYTNEMNIRWQVLFLLRKEH